MPTKKNSTASWKGSAKKGKAPVLAPHPSTLEALMKLSLEAPAAPQPSTPPTGDDLINAVQFGDIEAAIELIGAGVDVNAKQPNGWTALLHAADKGLAEVAKLLLEKGAEINHRNTPTGRAAIHYAAMHEDDTVLKILIEGGADIEVRNSDGETPLLDAAAAGSDACVRLLIDSGCDVDAKNLKGKGAVYAAATGSHGDTAELLVSYPVLSLARREAQAAQKRAENEALTGATTILQEKVAVGRPLVFKLPARTG
jgi:ankyrin repeat protein